MGSSSLLMEWREELGKETVKHQSLSLLLTLLPYGEAPMRSGASRPGGRAIQATKKRAG
jgi:hypothetical protein